MKIEMKKFISYIVLTGLLVGVLANALAIAPIAVYAQEPPQNEEDIRRLNNNIFEPEVPIDVEGIERLNNEIPRLEQPAGPGTVFEEERSRQETSYNRTTTPEPVKTVGCLEFTLGIPTGINFVAC